MKLLYFSVFLLFHCVHFGCASIDRTGKVCDKRLQDFAGSFRLWAYDRHNYLSKVQSVPSGSPEYFDLLAKEHVINQRGESLEREARTLSDNCPYEKRRSLVESLRFSKSQDFAMNRVLSFLSAE